MLRINVIIWQREYYKFSNSWLFGDLFNCLKKV